MRDILLQKEKKNIRVLGNEGLGIVYVGADTMLSGNYMSEHDKVISEKLGFVLCGGDLSENTVVSEQYLLDMERKAFLAIVWRKKDFGAFRKYREERKSIKKLEKEKI